MNNTVDIRMRFEDLLECWLIGDIDLVEDGPLAAQQLDAVQADLGRIVQAVDNNHIVAVLEKSEGRERSDVACATVVEDIVSTAIFIPPALIPRVLRFVWRETRKACLPSNENGSDSHCQRSLKRRDSQLVSRKSWGWNWNWNWSWRRDGGGGLGPRNCPL